jgi:hypothetical protein
MGEKFSKVMQIKKKEKKKRGEVEERKPKT